MRPLIGAMAFLMLGAAAAAAQKAPFGLGQDLRLEGIVDPPPSATAQSLGTIRIRAGKTVRKLGVITAQTARAEGMSLFKRSSLHPEQLLLRADAAMLATFRDAPAGTRLNMLGRYTGDAYILASITVASASPTPPMPGTPQQP